MYEESSLSRRRYFIGSAATNASADQRAAKRTRAEDAARCLTCRRSSLSSRERSKVRVASSDASFPAIFHVSFPRVHRLEVVDLPAGRGRSWTSEKAGEIGEGESQQRTEIKRKRTHALRSFSALLGSVLVALRSLALSHLATCWLRIRSMYLGASFREPPKISEGVYGVRKFGNGDRTRDFGIGRCYRENRFVGRWSFSR